MNVMIWLGLLILFLVAEAATLGLTSIWFAGGALVGAVAAALHAPAWLQFTLAILVSLLLLYFTRPIAAKYFNKNRVRTNADSLIGQAAVVTAEINNLQGMGQVIAGNLQWSARSVEEGITIPVGAIVVVESISGVKLMVREEKPKEKETETEV